MMLALAQSAREAARPEQASRLGLALREKRRLVRWHGM